MLNLLHNLAHALLARVFHLYARHLSVLVCRSQKRAAFLLNIDGGPQKWPCH